jgi:hypothetical protein
MYGSRTLSALAALGAHSPGLPPSSTGRALVPASVYGASAGNTARWCGSGSGSRFLSTAWVYEYGA